MNRAPVETVRASLQRLDAALALPFPSRHENHLGHSDALNALAKAVLQEGGTFSDQWNGARVSLHGYRATSTSGLRAAIQNWCAQVRKKLAVPA